VWILRNGNTGLVLCEILLYKKFLDGTHEDTSEIEPPEMELEEGASWVISGL
jgi:hypothetical protein